MKNTITFLFLTISGIIASLCLGADLTSEQILRKIDDQMLTKTSYMEAEMTIISSDSSPRTLKFKAYSIGRDLALMEYTAPAREKGIKFLRREKTMWLYFPLADRIRQIKDHMLREGMMGSDFSYEDASETDSVYDHYNSNLLGQEKFSGRDVYVLELIAKDNEVTYQKRRLWVDTEWFVPLKEELFAKSGMLLKELQMGDVKTIGGHYYPTTWIMINKLTATSSTELKLTDIKIDIPVDENLFSLENLKRR
jgi:outer membrane lipoprotein-sorting protein